MKRTVLLLAGFSGLSLLSVTLFAATAAPKPSSDVPSAGLEFAKTATQITGIAISPLLGVSAVGAYQWAKADTPAEKAALPWFANPLVWVTGFLLVGGVAFKDSFGAVIPPGMKKPFDMLEVAENKVSGLVATGAVVPVLVNAMSQKLGGTTGALDLHLHVGNLAMIHLGAVNTSWLLNLLMVPLSVAVFAIVWVASHAINVLILLSPWGAVDAVLKSARTALLGLMTATAFIDPVVGVTLSAIVVVIAYLISGWAFRLTVFGTVFTWDFLTGKRHRFRPDAQANKAFLARPVEGAPLRTWGRVSRDGAGELQFTYRPWLVLPGRTVALPADALAVGRGAFWPTVEFQDQGGDNRTLLTLPPRYKGHEQEFATACGITGLRDVGLRRGWAILKEMLGMGAGKAAAVAT